MPFLVGGTVYAKGNKVIKAQLGTNVDKQRFLCYDKHGKAVVLCPKE